MNPRSPLFSDPRFPARAPHPFAQIFSDRALWLLLAAALALTIALAIFLLIRFESLPEVLPLHFDASGVPDRIETKAGIFGLPIIGMLVFLLNAVLAALAHRAERAASILLAASALLVQALMWLGALNIVGGFFPA